MRYGKAGIWTLAAGALCALAAGCLREDPVEPPYVDAGTVWLPLETRSVDEDSPDGTLLYPSLKQRVRAEAPPDFTVRPGLHLDAYFSDDDLLLRGLEPDFNGADTLLVTADGQEARLAVHVAPLDDPTYWETLEDRTIPEDSDDGTLLYPGLRLLAHADGEPVFGTPAAAHLEAYYSGDDLLVRNMEPDFFGPDTVTVTADEATVRFAVAVSAVDDPAVWAVLQDQAVEADSPDATIVYADLLDRLSDVDSPRDIVVVGSHDHFALEYSAPHLRIFDLTPGWTGSERIDIEGNGVGASFQLDVEGGVVACDDGVLAYLPLDGNATDACGDNDGTVNGAQPTTDRDGQSAAAYLFDGGDSISLGDRDLIQSAFTLAAWIRPTGGAGQNRTILNKWNWTEGGWWLGITDEGKLRFSCSDFLSVDWAEAAYAPPLGEWHHVAVAYGGAGTQIVFYLDGTELFRLSMNIAIPNTAIALLIGYEGDASDAGFYGAIDEVRIYDRALSAVQIQALAE